MPAKEIVTGRGKLLGLGADGYILKNAGKELFTEGIMHVMQYDDPFLPQP